VALFLVSTNGNAVYNLTLVPEVCLKNKAITGDYTPLGRIINIGNLPVYEYEAPENVNEQRMLIAVYDIFGFGSENLKHVTDQLAIQSGGFRAVLPDFFRGESSGNQIEPGWIDRVGDWNSIVKPDLINVVQHYQSEGVEEFAIFGFCWGGKVATLASIELSEFFKASALVHPSSVTNDEALDVQIPMYLMPTQNEPDMLPFYEVLQSKFGNNSGHRRFDDMVHGFAGARGNFSDPLIQERVNEVITTLGEFFDRNLRQDNHGNAVNIYPSYLLMITLITSVFATL